MENQTVLLRLLFYFAVLHDYSDHLHKFNNLTLICAKILQNDSHELAHLTFSHLYNEETES